MMEILLPWVDGVSYGDEVELRVPAEEIVIG